MTRSAKNPITTLGIAGECLEDRLQGPARSRVRVLGEVDRGTQTRAAWRPRIAIPETTPIPTNNEMQVELRPGAGARSRDHSAPSSTLDRKFERPEEQREHDAEADDARNGRGRDEHRLDHALLPPAPGRLSPGASRACRCRVPPAASSPSRSLPPLAEPSGSGAARQRRSTPRARTSVFTTTADSHADLAASPAIRSAGSGCTPPPRPTRARPRRSGRSRRRP